MVLTPAKRKKLRAQMASTLRVVHLVLTTGYKTCRWALVKEERDVIENIIDTVDAEIKSLEEREP